MLPRVGRTDLTSREVFRPVPVVWVMRLQQEAVPRDPADQPECSTARSAPPYVVCRQAPARLQQRAPRQAAMAPC